MEAINQFWLSYGSAVQFMLIDAALGLSIYITLSTGLLSLANAGFMAIGAYTSALATLHWQTPFPLSLLLGILAAGAAGLILGLPALRLRDVYLAIATIGFGEVVRGIILNIDKVLGYKLTGGALGLNNIPVKTELWHLLLYLALLIYFFIRLSRSRTGRALVAIRRDETVAATMGIDVVYYKNMAFVIGAMIAGGAGGLAAHLTRFIGPNEFGFARAVDILTYAVLGGFNHWLGPLIGGLTLTGLPELLRFLAAYRPIVNGIILMLAIIYLPSGLADPARFRRLRAL
jgi:branched-chain amino acid transport system permease protein